MKRYRCKGKFVAMIFALMPIGCLDLDDSPGEEVEVIDAALASATTYFSQRDARWSSDKLGTSNLTLGGYGCALTAATIAAKSRNAQTDPGAMNRWLKSNGGFVSGNLLVWSKVADFDGPNGLVWVGTGTLPTTTQGVKALLDQGKLIVVRSTRFAEHWVIIGGYLNSGSSWAEIYYFDPYDLMCVQRTLGDANAWVKANSAIRIYR